MFSECRSRRIHDAYIKALTTRLIYLRQDCAPHQPLRWIERRCRFALDAHHGAYGIAYRPPVSTEQDDRWRAMARDVGASSVDDVCEINTRQKDFNDL